MDPELFAQVVDDAPDGILIVDAGGRIVFANRRSEMLFGYPPLELIGRPIELLVPESLRGRHIAHQATFHARPSSRPMGVGLELRALRRDGTEFPVEISLSPMPTKEGTLVTAIIRDVSERHALEDTRRRAEERYRLLAEQARDIVYRIRLTPAPPRIEYMSPAAREITGYAPEEHYADPDLLVTMVAPDYRPLIEALIEDPGSAQNPLTVMVVRRDRSLIWLEHQFSIIQDAQGQPVAIEGIARDITARVREDQERQYLRAQAELMEERERIARDLHDGVMQSLYAVGLSLITLGGEIVDAAPGAVPDLDRAVRDLNGAIADIRSYVMDLQHERSSDAVASLLITLAQELQSEAGIEATVDVADQLPPLEDTHRVAIYHIVREALSNVRRHSMARHVHLSMRASDGGVQMDVSDDGAGFNAAVDPGREHMGLRNMRARAHDLGGELELKSAPGHGTTVHLALPVAREEAPTPAAT